MNEMKKTESEWRQQLSSEQFRILRQQGTELPFTGSLLRNVQTGRYLCAGCQTELFSSDAKFESGSGWPSFFQPIADDAIEFIHDTSGGLDRFEVRCRRCGGHLGHVFSDGPKPTGRRFCINSAALEFKKNE